MIFLHNYYNYKSLLQQAMKTLFRFSLYLLFVLLLCSCHKVHAEKIRETLPKSQAPKTIIVINKPVLYTSLTMLACACLVASSQVTSSNKNGANVIMGVTDPLWYIGLMILSLVGWRMLFDYLSTTTWLDHFPIDKREKLASNIVSSLHGAFIFFGALGHFTKQIGIKYWRMLLCISMGYFWSHFCSPWQMDSGQEMYFMLVHHVAVMLCISTAFVAEKVYAPYLGKLSPSDLLTQGLLSEITMPFIYACWYLIYMRQKESLHFTILSILSLSSYAVFRVVNFTHIGYVLYQNRKTAISPLALFTPIVLLNYYWFIDLCKRAMKALG